MHFNILNHISIENIFAHPQDEPSADFPGSKNTYACQKI